MKVHFSLVCILFYLSSCLNKTVDEKENYLAEILPKHKIYNEKTYFSADSLFHICAYDLAEKAFSKLTTKDSLQLYFVKCRLLSLSSLRYYKNQDLYNEVLQIPESDSFIFLVKNQAIFEYNYWFDSKRMNMNKTYELIKLWEGNPYLTSSIYNSLGKYYKEINFDLDSSVYYFEMAEQVLEPFKFFTKEHLECYTNIIDIYPMQRKETFALKYGNLVSDFNLYFFTPKDEFKLRAILAHAMSIFRYNRYEYFEEIVSIIDKMKNLSLNKCSKQYQEFVALRIHLSNIAIEKISVLDSKIESLEAEIFENKYSSKEEICANIDTLMSQTNSLIMNLKHPLQHWRQLDSIQGICKTRFENPHYLSLTMIRNTANTEILVQAMERSIEFELQANRTNYQRFYLLLNYLGQLFLDNHDYEKSLKTFYKNIDAYKDDIQTKDILALSQSKKSKYRFVYLTYIGKVFLKKYNDYGKIEDLEFAKNLVENINESIYNEFDAFDEDAILKHFDQVAADFFSFSLDVYFELWDRNKSTKDFERFIQQNDKSRSNILFRYLNNESFPIDLQNKIKETNQKIELEKIKGIVNNKSLNEAITQKQKIDNNIKEKFSNVYSNSFNFPDFSLLKTQNLLKNTDYTILMINQNSDHFYVSFINGDKFDLYKIPFTTEIENELYNLKTILHEELDIIPQNYQAKGFKIFSWLFPDGKAKYLNENIILFSDGIFSELPISALCHDLATNPNKFSSLAYMGDKYEINVGYKLSMLSKSTNLVLKNAGILAFTAPSSDEKPNHSMAYLSGAKKEIELLKNHFEHLKVFEGLDCNEHNFRNLYQDSTIDILHLALHGQTNADKKNEIKLYFNNKKHLDTLYGIELLGIKGKPKVVILSACQTASGKSQKGDGVLNLPSYFFLNNAQYVYASIWDVDDRASALKIEQVYQKLLNLKNSNVIKNDLHPSKYHFMIKYTSTILCRD